MRKPVVFIIVAVLALAGIVMYTRGSGTGAGPAAGGSSGGRFGGPRAPMPVQFATVSRNQLEDQILVVGNLTGAATVEVVPKVAGRLQAVNVRIGDTVRRGQLLAKVEDLELQQQVHQAEASFAVAQATIRQREADLKLAQSNLERNKSLLDRQLLPVQTYEDTEARAQAAAAQLDLARAQYDQAKSRLDELKITLSNTNVLSPVDGFVGKRFLDAGSFASTNAPVVSVVDIHIVRLVANLVEKDARRVHAGTPAAVEVDAFPGERFKGTVSRVAPVFDPATRTAEMEIEVPNPGYRLKPGMYARVNLTVDTRQNALTVPRNALVDVDGRTGVFIAEPPGTSGDGPSAGGASRGTATNGGERGGEGRQGGGARGTGAPALVAKFLPVETGIRSGELVEVLGGLSEGTRVITMGAGALREGDRVVLASDDGRAGSQRPAGGPGQRQDRGQTDSRAEATR